MKASPALRSRVARVLVLAVVGALAAPTVAQTADRRFLQQTVAYPTGSASTSIVLLEHFFPAELRAGRDFDYIFRLTNLTRADLQGLVLTIEMPPDVDVKGYEVAPTRESGQTFIWEVPQLRAEQSLNFRLRAVASRVGDVVACATLAFRTSSCAAARVVQPGLELLKAAPPEATPCDRIPLRFQVYNPGSGVAQNVVIRDTLPRGWQTEDAKPEILINVGDLAPGQAKEAVVFVRAGALGMFDNVATATAADGLSSQARASTRIVRCNLRVTQTVPDVRYLGRSARVDVTVENIGDAPARDAQLTSQLPAGLSVLAASDNGRLSGSAVSWALGTLAPGERRTVNLTIDTRQIGNFNTISTARAYCCESSAEAPLAVRGVPAILLEVVDLDDPIEVGANNTYEISVLNQGSADGTNVQITCVLPAEQEFVSADGPTRGTITGKEVTFAPIPVLAPKQTAKYRVVVRGIGTGDVRFRVTMNSDQLRQPVEETESTYIYE